MKMEEFELVNDEAGFTWKRKRVPDGADDDLKRKIQGYNRQTRKRARDRHAQPPGQKQKSVGGRGHRANGRPDVQFVERPTPTRSSGATYMHELSPDMHSERSPDMPATSA